MTTDGTVPHRLFLMLLEAGTAMEATAEAREGRAVALGIALALNGDDSKVKHAVKSLLSQAYPQRFD